MTEFVGWIQPTERMVKFDYEPPPTPPEPQHYEGYIAVSLETSGGEPTQQQNVYWTWG